MEHSVRILMKEFVTHNTVRFIVERPEGYAFRPGQATELSVDQPGWRDKKRPFTFTSLEGDHVLEFTIKGYPERDGVTKKLHALEPGDSVIIRDVWGAIRYRGPGVFIAGGAGITPFIAILRKLWGDSKIQGNTLIFSNRMARDVILEPELRHMLGKSLILTLTREDANGYEKGRVDRAFLKSHVDDFSQNFYVCGPDDFVKEVTGALEDLGASAESIVIEE